MAEAISRHALDQSANRLSQPVGLGLVTTQAVLAGAGAVVDRAARNGTGLRQSNPRDLNDACLPLSLIHI